MTTTDPSTPPTPPTEAPLAGPRFQFRNGRPAPRDAGPTPERVAAIQRLEEVRHHQQVADNSASTIRIIIGVIAIAIGLLVTSVTYSSAQGGGTYVVAYGPVIYGVISLFRGLAART